MKKQSSCVALPNTKAVAKEHRPSGRPRSEASKHAVLTAAYEILKETGIACFTVEAVASRSGAARTTIYRWWPTKGALAIESFLDAFRVQLRYRRTSNSDENFRSFVLSLASALAGPAGRVAASVMAQAQHDDATRKLFLEKFSEPLRTQTSELLADGVAAGCFRADLDVPRVIDAAVGAVYLRLLFGQSLDQAWARDLTHTLLNGCYAPSHRMRLAKSS